MKFVTLLASSALAQQAYQPVQNTMAPVNTSYNTSRDGNYTSPEYYDQTGTAVTTSMPVNTTGNSNYDKFLPQERLFSSTDCGEPLKNEWDRMDPMPKACKVYKNSNHCNKYELDLDGETVLSCDIAEACIATIEDPECVQFYQKQPRSVPDKESSGANGQLAAYGVALFTISQLL